MSQQASLPGFAPAVATDRLFLAIFPDSDTAGQLADLAARECARHDLRGKPLPGDRFHVTLFHLGDWAGLRDDIVAAAMQAGARAKAAPFDVRFDRTGSFSGGREKLPFVLKAQSAGNAELRAFRTTLGGLLREAGVEHGTANSFEPHVTLAYDARMIAAEAVTPISWRVREFVLVHSLLGKTRHIRLGRWLLE